MLCRAMHPRLHRVAIYNTDIFTVVSPQQKRSMSTCGRTSCLEIRMSEGGLKPRREDCNFVSNPTVATHRVGAVAI